MSSPQLSSQKPSITSEEASTIHDYLKSAESNTEFLEKHNITADDLLSPLILNFLFESELTQDQWVQKLGRLVTEANASKNPDDVIIKLDRKALDAFINSEQKAAKVSTAQAKKSLYSCYQALLRQRKDYEPSGNQTGVKVFSDQTLDRVIGNNWREALTGFWKEDGLGDAKLRDIAIVIDIEDLRNATQQNRHSRPSQSASRHHNR